MMHACGLGRVLIHYRLQISDQVAQKFRVSRLNWSEVGQTPWCIVWQVQARITFRTLVHDWTAGRGSG